MVDVGSWGSSIWNNSTDIINCILCEIVDEPSTIGILEEIVYCVIICSRYVILQVFNKLQNESPIEIMKPAIDR
jgi:hypothetical protein